MNKKTIITLILILLIAFMLRFTTVMVFEQPVSFDSPYHLIQAQGIIETGKVTSTGLPYPPLYHVLLSTVFFLTGLELKFIGSVMLPLISVLTVLSVFVFVKRIKNEKNALIAALLTALSGALIIAAYDSPENIILFLLPLIILFSDKISFKLLIGFTLLWNYLAFGISFVTFIFFKLKQRKTLYLTIIIVLIAAGLLFYNNNLVSLENFNTSSSAEFVSNAISKIMPAFLIVMIVLTIPIIILSKKYLVKETKYWYYLLIISFLLSLSFFITPLLRGWEFLKFVSISSVLLIGCMTLNKNVKRFIVFFATLYLLSGLIAGFQGMYAKTTGYDLQVIDYLQPRLKDGRILAEPSYSDSMVFNSDFNKNQFITHLYLENNSNNYSITGLKFLPSLGLENKQEELEFLKNSNTKFLVLNFEDIKTREPSGFENKEHFNKTYSLKYYQPCLFEGGAIGLHCGINETKVLEFNERRKK
ncbi:MAG: hypothetical protein ABH821_02705 [archaeon]